MLNQTTLQIWKKFGIYKHSGQTTCGRYVTECGEMLTEF